MAALHCVVTWLAMLWRRPGSTLTHAFLEALSDKPKLRCMLAH